MMAIQASDPRLSIKTVSFSVLRGTLAQACAEAGFFKRSGDPAAVAELDEVGFGQNPWDFTAVPESAGAFLPFRPRTIAVGAILLGTICAAASLAQLLALHGDVVHTVVLGLILATVAWRHRAQLTPVG